ncbi:hypothetical protein [Williamwhitmania taraxaci]|uniref:Outer membrane protein beta-barrel domain-containing protein n=1 Tax=Williamwhitmania taraxaci TaxID=1640674 RepID=A0A1G6PTF8_9BACT|nr:hypothetical protein [Williamwhitmania taraxaci]SDC82655.1 hypothetical protein SAMN05216323_105420 [Williamwhitmania taraxaci]
MGNLKIWGTTLLLVTLSVFSIAQTESGSTDSLQSTVTQTPLLSLSGDIKSRHTWRGGLTCSAMNLQPTLNLRVKNFTLGAWGCYTVDNSYAEIDLYATYKLGNFSASLLDYYNPIEGVKKNDVFDYNQDSTRHLIDVNVKFHGTTDFPVYLLASTLIYGADKKPDSNSNRYSTYFEAGYTCHLRANQQVDIFLGGTPHKSYYATEAAIVNIGMTARQNIQVFGQYNLPLYISMIVNPKYENIYFILGITIL